MSCRNVLIAAGLLFFVGIAAAQRHQDEDRMLFHSSLPWRADLDLGYQTVLLEQPNDTYGDRSLAWLNKSHTVYLLTGAVAGDYVDFISGVWDGSDHAGSLQATRVDSLIQPVADGKYLVPDSAYISYLRAKVRFAINCGAEAVVLAYPEFWTNAGYSDSFKQLWSSKYHEDWQDPRSTAGARFKAEKLKYELLTAMVDTVCAFAKSYARIQSKPMQCYVLTRSVIDHAHRGIVAPVAGLMNLRHCDGIIGEITSEFKRKSIYGGLKRERPFETMLIEYGAFANIVRGYDKKLWLSINTPPWIGHLNPADRLARFRAQTVAALMQPSCQRFDLGAWPTPLLTGLSRSAEHAEAAVASDSTDSTHVRPQAIGFTQLATTTLTVAEALRHMPASGYAWEVADQGVGILLSDAALLQLATSDSTDLALHFIYGITMPLLKRGIIVQPLAMENLSQSNYLNGFKILFLSYRFMKPMHYSWHEKLAKWTRAGGTLVLVDDENDLYNDIKDWWRDGMFDYSIPAEHLFEELKLGYWPKPGKNSVGMGSFIYLTEPPSAFAKFSDGPYRLLSLLESLYPVGQQLRQQNYVSLRRGPYLAAATFDETADTTALQLRGSFLDLFDPALARRDTVVIKPGEQALLFDLSRIDSSKAQVLAGSATITTERLAAGEYEFTARGPAETPARLVLFVPYDSLTISASCADQALAVEVDQQQALCWIAFENLGKEVRVLVKWRPALVENKKDQS